MYSFVTKCQSIQCVFSDTLSIIIRVIPLCTQLVYVIHQHTLTAAVSIKE